MIAAMTYAKNNADISTMASLEVRMLLTMIHFLLLPLPLPYSYPRPAPTPALLQGVMGALYFGLGKSLGSLTGGLAIEAIGVRNTFR